MTIKCPQCQKQYCIDAAQIPAGKQSLKCPGCAHAIPLKKRPSGTSIPRGETVSIACAGCGKRYRIPKAMITGGKKTATCKVCNETILLTLPTHRRQASAPAAPPSKDKGPDFSDQLTAWFTKRRICMLGAGFVIFIVAIVALPPLLRGFASLGGQVTSNMAGYVKDGTKALSDSLADHKKKPTSSTQVTNQPASLPIVSIDPNDPVLALTLNPQLIYNTLGSLPIAKPLLERLYTLDIQQAHLWLCPDPNRVVLPTIALEVSQAASLQSLVSQDGWLAPYITHLAPQIYQLNKPILIAALPSTSIGRWDQLPLERYTLSIIDKQIIFAPTDIATRLQQHPDTLHQCALENFLAPTLHAQDLANLSIDLAPQRCPGWTQKLCDYVHTIYTPLNAPELTETPETRMARNLSCLSGTQRLALSFSVTPDLQRQITYRQEYRNQVDGSAVFHKLQAGAFPVSSNAPAMEKIAANAFTFPKIQRSMTFADNQLTLDVNWPPAQDYQIRPYVKNLLVGPSSVAHQGILPSTNNSETTSPAPPATQSSLAATDRFLNTLFCCEFSPQPGSCEYDLARALLTLKKIRHDNPRMYGEDLANLYFVAQRGQLRQMIPHEYAVADPINPTGYGYELKPYRGYLFKPIPTRAYTTHSLQQWRTTQGRRYPWTGTKYKYLSIANVPNLVATPADNQGPTFVYAADEDRLYFNRNTETDIKSLPVDLSERSGWIKLNTTHITPHEIASNQVP